LILNHSSTFTFSGAISGTGTLTHAGTGLTTLTGDLTHSGGTTISQGTLQIGDGGTAGTIAGNIVDNGALVFNRSDAITFGGGVSGSGTLTQQGSGILALTVASTYTGATTVSAGTLQVDGSLGNTATTVQSGATLQRHRQHRGAGDGARWRAHRAGDSPGTLSVGTLTLNAGSIPRLRIEHAECRGWREQRPAPRQRRSHAQRHAEYLDGGPHLGCCPAAIG